MSPGAERDMGHRTCPFKSIAGGGEIGRGTSPKEMCTHTCGLWCEKEQSCAIRLIAVKLAQPVSVVLQGSDKDIETPSGN